MVTPTRILILTGPPAVGKNTITAELAPRLSRCAVIDVDLVRWMIVQPHHAPWDGEEGLAQQRLGVQNACLLAKQFVRASYPVIIHDVLSNDTAHLYRAELAEYEPQIVLLLPTFVETMRRGTCRPARLHDDEVALLYAQQRQFTNYDHKIDTTALPPKTVAVDLARLIVDASSS